MKTYEMMTIIKGDLGESGAKDVLQEVTKIIVDLNGEVIKDDFWGKRKFAYKINHEQEGYYEVKNFNFPPEKMKELKAKLNLVANLVRYLIMVTEDKNVSKKRK